MAQLVITGFLNGAGATQSFFTDFVASNKVRSYNAFPTDPNLPFDAQTEIIEVFHLLKHGSGELQANYIVQNKVGGPWGPNAGGVFTSFQIWVTES